LGRFDYVILQQNLTNIIFHVIYTLSPDSEHTGRDKVGANLSSSTLYIPFRSEELPSSCFIITRDAILTPAVISLQPVTPISMDDHETKIKDEKPTRKKFATPPVKIACLEW